MMKKQKTILTLHTAAAAFFLAVGWNLFDDAFIVLFAPDKSYILDRELAYSRHDVWCMHTGLWYLFAFVYFAISTVVFAVWFHRSNGKQQESQHHNAA